MKKSIFYIVLLFLFCSLLGVSVVKAENKCDINTKSKLISLATNLNITYDVELAPPITLEDEENGKIPYDYIKIKIYNLNTKLRVKVINETNGNVFNVNYKNIGSDGAVTIKKVLSSKINNYKFVVYGNSDCYDVVLKTFKLTLPRQNYLSNLDMCQDIQDYYLCQPLVTYEINDDYAYRAIADYAAKREAEGDKNDKSKDNTGIIRKTLTSFSNNKKYISLIFVVIGIVITFVILKKKRSDR